MRDVHAGRIEYRGLVAVNEGVISQAERLTVHWRRAVSSNTPRCLHYLVGSDRHSHRCCRYTLGPEHAGMQIIEVRQIEQILIDQLVARADFDSATARCQIARIGESELIMV